MATGTDIIEGALRKLKVISPEIPMESHYSDNGLVDLNDFGLLLETSLPLGFTALSSASSAVNIPVEAVGMYKSNLAIYLAPQYGKTLDPLLLKEAGDSKKAVLRAFQQTLEVDFPDSLPMGSGNSGLAYDEQEFFPANKDVNF